MTPLATADELERLVHRATAELRRTGARPGDRVATVVHNHPAAFALSWALQLAGIVEVPLPPSSSADEATDLLDQSGPVAFVHHHDDPVPPGVGAAVGTATGRERLHVVTVGLDAAGPTATPTAAAPRTRALAFTSGTTGRRKGVEVGVHDDTWGRAWLDDEHAAFDARHGERHVVVSPLYHSGPLRHALVVADRGGAVTVLPRFDVELLLDALRTVRPTSLFVVPTHLHRLLAHPDLHADDLASVTLLLHAGAPCPRPLKERLHELAPDGSVWEFYGSTEGQFAVCPPGVWAQAPGVVGHARPGRQLSVRREDGTEATTDEVGTVWTTAPWHARWRYLDRPDATDAAWDGDAFTVADLGALDAAGRLTLHGRPGDLVITGGVNVYPAEVERVLLDLPGVGEVAVFGVPDDEWGARLVAAVVPHAAAPTPDADDLLRRARVYLSAARVPKQLLVVDDLPRTPTGKVRRADLPTLVLP